MRKGDRIDERNLQVARLAVTPSGTIMRSSKAMAAATCVAARCAGTGRRPHAPRERLRLHQAQRRAALIRKGSLNTHQHASADQSYPSG